MAIYASFLVLKIKRNQNNSFCYLTFVHCHCSFLKQNYLNSKVKNTYNPEDL